MQTEGVLLIVLVPAIVVLGIGLSVCFRGESLERLELSQAEFRAQARREQLQQVNHLLAKENARVEKQGQVDALRMQEYREARALGDASAGQIGVQLV